MARRSKSDQEQGYLRSFWDEVREMEADYAGLVTCSLECGQRPGIVRIRLSFAPFAGDAYNTLGVQTVLHEFPNAQQGSLASTLWASSLKLLALVEGADFKYRSAPQT